MRRFILRLLNVFRRDRAEYELAREVDSHLALLEEEHRRRGVTFDQAREMLAKRGAIGAWLWEEYQAWYFRYVKPLRVNDFSKPWVIWDNITLAYVLGMTTHATLPRPRLRDDMTFEKVNTDKTVTWITDVDEQRMWADFLSLVDEYQRTHAVGSRAMSHRLTFMLP